MYNKISMGGHFRQYVHVNCKVSSTIALYPTQRLYFTCIWYFQISTLRFATRMMRVAIEPAVNVQYDPAVSV